MNNSLLVHTFCRVNKKISTVFVMLMVLLATSTNANPSSDGSLPPNADIEVTLLTTPPVNGFQANDVFQIQIAVTNVDNSNGAFRVDILDNPMFDIDVFDALRFGNNIILREATFSHGIFLRTLVNSNGQGKLADMDEVQIQFAEMSDTYTWLIDNRFRNGTLQSSDVATLTLTVELVASQINVVKTTNGSYLNNRLFVDFTQTDGSSGGSRFVNIPVDYDFTPPSEMIKYTTKIAPAGLQAGEPYLVEVGIFNGGQSYEGISYQVDLNLNHGYSPFRINTFYDSVLPASSPNHRDGFPMAYSSLSYSNTYYYINGLKPTADKTNEGFYNFPFLMTYQPDNELFSVRSVDFYCLYSQSFEDDCDVSPINTYGGSYERLFIQGAATLEMAGDNATVTGGISISPNFNCKSIDEIGACKAADPSESFITDNFVVNESLAIAPFIVSKTVSDDCFEEGEEGFFELSVTGADLKKTPSIFILIDKLPSNTDLLSASLNFRGDINYSNFEAALIAKGLEGVALYQFANIAYFNYFTPTKSPNGIHTQTPVQPTYDWYDTYTLRMDFEIGGGVIEAGERINTGLFAFETPLFTMKYWNVSKIASQNFLFTDFLDFDFDTMTMMYEGLVNNELADEIGILHPASANYTIGCVNITVSGYKFEDHNANGVRDQGDHGLAGWTIILQGSAGTFTTTTDNNGYYLFEGLKAGLYQVREESQEGWRQSYPAGEGFYNVSVSSALSSVTADFGNYRPAHVYGYKYVDLDGSGTMDQGEPGLEGVRIFLKDLSGNMVAETLSDADGYFHFEGLDPGTYGLYEDIPEGMFQSQPGYEVGGFYSLTLISGDELGPKNFGNYYLTSIEGFVYYDGTPPPKGVSGASILNERFPAPGVVVTGVRTGPAPLKPTSDPTVLPGQSNFIAVTDDNGYFMVNGLLPGLYTLTVTPPNPYTSVITPNPLTEVLVSGGYVEIEFGLFYDSYAAPEVNKSSITGSVFADANGNGSWDFPAESGVASRSVSLIGKSKRGTSITRTTTTGSDGSYTFSELPEGRYVVSVQSVVGASVSYPHSSSHVVVLGENQNIGLASSGAPGGVGWLQAAMAGDDVTFGSLVLAIDTDLNGHADTRLDLSGLAKFVLGGITGQTVRPFALTTMSMYGNNLQGEPIVAATPGLIEGLGELAGSGAQVSRGMESGLVISAGGDFFYTSDPIPFVGSADRWPIRNTSAVFNAITAGGPVNLRDIEGNVVARILYAEHKPTYGADFAVERADFGDAPATYGTLRALPGDPFVVTTTGIVYPLDGARHLMPWTGSPALRLGASVSADANGQPGASADGDFDDGVELPAAVAPNSAFEATVSVTGAGLLSVWVDQNRNGVFEPSERLVSDVAVTTGEYDVTLHSGATNTSGLTFVRVRLTTQADVGATGLALDGEVEDYMLTIDASLASGGGGLPTSDDGDAGLPTSFALHQNYPNPFNPTTVIPYDLASTSRVRITVYDVTGRPVASLLDAQQNAGRHQVAFNAAGLPSGVYMVRLEAGGQLMVRKLTLIK